MYGKLKTNKKKNDISLLLISSRSSKSSKILHTYEVYTLLFTYQTSKLEKKTIGSSYWVVKRCRFPTTNTRIMSGSKANSFKTTNLKVFKFFVFHHCVYLYHIDIEFFMTLFGCNSSFLFTRRHVG